MAKVPSTVFLDPLRDRGRVGLWPAALERAGLEDVV